MSGDDGSEVVDNRLRSKRVDRERFADPTPRAIARVVRDEALGAGAIARELGKQANDVGGALQKMVKDGTLLREDPLPGSPERVLYRLAPGLEDAIDEALFDIHEPGYMARGQLALIVRGLAAAKVIKTLKQSDVVGALSWAARLGDEALMLVFDGEQGDFVVDRLDDLFDELGARVEQLVVRDVMAPRSFIDRGSALRSIARIRARS